MRSVTLAIVVCGLCCASSSPSSAADVADWSRVRTLAPGTEIILTVAGSEPGSRYVISVDELGLTVLNVTDPALGAGATDALRDIAEHHPDYFAAAQAGQTIEVDSLRIERDGVFVANRSVAPREQIVERESRVSIQRIQRMRGRSLRDAGIGFVIGVAAVVVGTLRITHDRGEVVLVYGGLYGAIGALIGAVHGRATHPYTVYEAP